LLGSRAYVARAKARGEKIVANVNSDMYMPLYPMRKLVVFGLDESDLGPEVRGVAKKLGVGVTPDPQPARNRFIRSDQYSFVRAGIPAVALKVGFDQGTPEAEIDRRWFEERYHAVGDSPDQPVDLAAVGMYEELVTRFAESVANRKAAPRWNPDSVFAKK
jgi:Zn-dependent M28 family amino/carboxypeptidase